MINIPYLHISIYKFERNHFRKITFDNSYRNEKNRFDKMKLVKTILSLLIIAQNSADARNPSSNMTKLCSKNICSKCSEILLFGEGKNPTLRRTCETLLRIPRCCKRSPITIL